MCQWVLRIVQAQSQFHLATCSLAQSAPRRISWRGQRRSARTLAPSPSRSRHSLAVCEVLCVCIDIRKSRTIIEPSERASEGSYVLLDSAICMSCPGAALFSFLLGELLAWVFLSTIMLARHRGTGDNYRETRWLAKKWDHINFTLLGPVLFCCRAQFAFRGNVLQAAVVCSRFPMLSSLGGFNCPPLGAQCHNVLEFILSAFENSKQIVRLQKEQCVRLII